MKEFTDKSGAQMIEGTMFNWEKSFTFVNKTGPFVYKMAFGDVEKMHTALFHPGNNRLSIFDLSYDKSNGLIFKVENLLMAEFITISVMKQMKKELMPLYVRENHGGLDCEQYYKLISQCFGDIEAMSNDEIKNKISSIILKNDKK